MKLGLYPYLSLIGCRWLNSSMSMCIAAMLIGCFALLINFPSYAGDTTLISVNSAGDQDQGHNISSHALSADGRFVAFVAPTSLVTGTSGHWGILVRDTALGTTTLVSVDSGGVLANATSQSPAISADGRYVAFQSHSTNLVAGDTNHSPDIFVHDRQTAVTTRVSVDSAGIQANNESEFPAISADGRYVAFASRASNLIPDDTNPHRDIFVHDRATGETTRVSVDSAGLEANHQSTSPTLSADGRYVAFETRADNLAPGIPYSYGVVDFIVVHDRQTGESILASVSSTGIAGEGQHPSISADGRYVAFQSNATNLVVGDTNGNADIFVHDRQTGGTTRESVDSAGNQATGSIFYNHGSSFDPALSANGRYLAFASSADNLVAGDTNGNIDIFVHDRQSGATTRVNVNSTGGQVDNGLSDQPALSSEGRYVTFASSAANLVAGDTNGNVDIFMHDRGVQEAPWIQQQPQPQTATGTPPTIPAKNAVVITHGWNSDAEGWVQGLAQELCGKLGATYSTGNVQADTPMLWCSSANWDVWIVDWRSAAAPITATSILDGAPAVPVAAYNNAPAIGTVIFNSLKQSNYKHFHFIAHSAGSMVIDTATSLFKCKYENQSNCLPTSLRPTVQETFLDPYDPSDSDSIYGLHADWAENYVDTRDIFLGGDVFDRTKLLLKGAFNFDVTSIAPYDESWTGRHAWPYAYYWNSFSVSSLYSTGYVLSLESGQSLGDLSKKYSKGNSCILDSSTKCGSYSVNGTSAYTTHFYGLDVIGNDNILSSSTSETGTAIVTPAAGAPAVTIDMVSGSPVWVAIDFESPAQVNSLKLDYKFQLQAEGVLSIFVDDNRVRQVDERYAPSGANSTGPIWIGNIAPGRHTLAFRIDPYSDVQSSVELANIQLGNFAVVLVGDVDGDGDVDQDDLNMVLAARNMPASGPNDLRDLNGDGKINALDARKLTTLCTRPRCAIQ